MRKTVLRASTFLVAMLVTIAAHAVPGNFTVQGVLRDNAGALQTASVPVTIKIYNDQTATDPSNLLGAPVISQATMAENGLFTVSVPVDATLQAKLVSTTQAWLEVTAGADIFPRQPISADVYALIASDCMSLGGVAAADYLTEAEAASTYLTQSAAAATYQKLLKTTNCTAGKYIQAIDADGNVTCASDANSGGTVTNVSSTSNALTVTSGTTTPSLTVNGANITGLSGANITAGTIPKTALAASSLNHSHGLTLQASTETTVSLAANGIQGVCATCPANTLAIGGWCRADGGSNLPQLGSTFTDVPATPTQFCCGYKNTTGGSWNVRAQALCVSTGTNSATLP